LEFTESNTRHTFEIDGSEQFSVSGDITPGASLNVSMQRANGETLTFSALCRLDTAEEVSIYEAGGVLQRFAEDFLETKSANG